MFEPREGHPAPPTCWDSLSFAARPRQSLCIREITELSCFSPDVSMCEVKREGYLNLVGVEWQAAQEMGNYMC